MSSFWLASVRFLIDWLEDGVGVGRRVLAD